MASRATTGQVAALDKAGGDRPHRDPLCRAEQTVGGQARGEDRRGGR